MSYSTLQKDLERITLKKDLDQALERMVDFEEEVKRNEEEEESEEESESESEDEEEKDLKPTVGYVEILAAYLVGVVVGIGVSFSAFRDINGRSKDNQR